MEKNLNSPKVLGEMESGFPLPFLNTSCFNISLLFAFISLLFQKFFEKFFGYDFKSIMEKIQTNGVMYFLSIISFGCLAAVCGGKKI